MPFFKKQWWKDYFSFTQKERMGIIILVVVIIVIFLLPYFFSKPKHPEAATVAEFKDQIAKLEVKNDSTSYKPRYENQYNRNYEKYSDDELTVQGTLFYFDPNTAIEDDWKKLGVRDKTIHTIQNYLSKGGKFRKPEDILKIYGLKEAQAQRLLPYVKIAGAANNNGNTYTKEETATNTSKKENFSAIDINNADTNALKTLPGIGSKLSQRIVNFRDKLGGFYSTNQISEVYGLPDSTFQKIKARLSIQKGNCKQININVATANELKQHPYIRWNLANAICQYRQQHGDYQSVEDLRKIALVTEEDYKKIVSYISLK